MMNGTKIGLSPKELDLVTNADVILTKNAVMKKMGAMLGQLQEAQQSIIRDCPAFPDEVKSTTAKISKGENYQGLPYLVLDQPRYFNGEHTCAIRTLFWWGHFFSITLQLSGKYKLLFADKLSRQYTILSERHYFICTGEDPWEHHFGPGNYSFVGDIQEDAFKKMTGNHSFIKLARKFELVDLEKIPGKLEEEFRTLTVMLA
jgi:hypothetical protein